MSEQEQTWKARIICECSEVVEVTTLAFDVEQMAKEAMRFFGRDKHLKDSLTHKPVFAAFRKVAKK